MKTSRPSVALRVAALVVSAWMTGAMPVVAAAQLIPAPTGGTTPTIGLSAGHGAPGDRITVSGVAPASLPSSAVRVQWLLGAATEPVVEVAQNGAGEYLASVTVPPGAQPGAALLCAGLTDAALAELACTSFTIDDPAPGIVEGKLPGGTDRTAPPAAAGATDLASPLAVSNPFAATTVSLVAANGATVATAIPSARGEFRFTNVAPGSYTVVQGGAGPKAVAPAAAPVAPGAVSIVKAKATVTQMFCGTDQIPVNINNMDAMPAAPAANAHYGTYLSGVPLPVRFSLRPSDMFLRFDPALLGGAVPPVAEDEFDGIEYVFRNPQGQIVDRVRGNGLADAAVFDVGRLPPGISTVTPHPVVDGQVCLPPGFGAFRRTIRVIRNPLASFARADSSVSWRGGFSNAGFYRLNVIAPEIPGLPLSFPDPPLTQVPGTSFPLPIVVRNEFDARTTLRADVELDGDTTFRGFAAGFTFDILNTNVLDEEASITPPGNIRINFLEPRLSSFDVNIPSLLPIRQEFTIYEGTVLDLFGLVQVIGALTAGFQGDVGLFTTVQPFVPNLSVRVVPEVAAIGSVSAGLGALNFVSGGARLNTRIGIAVPFLVRIDPFFVGAENPCGILQASAELFVRLSAGPITLLRISSPTYPIVLPAGIPLYFPPPFCSLGDGLAASVAALDHQVPLALDDTLDDEPSPLPAVNPAAAVAVSADGERLRVHVEDATAGTDTITPRIVAQLQNPATGEWGAVLPITDGSHWVADPVVAWAGTGAGKIAVAAWTERPTTLAEDLAIDDDIGALLSRQEIYLAAFQGGTWSAPQRLTTDLLADGSASIAGDASGYTLAWTFDPDGNPATRSDARLKVRETLLAGGTTTTILASDAMSVDPSVVRRSGQSVIAFTKDYVANGIDELYRTIALVYGSGGSFTLDVNQLPYFADSPSLAITDDGREWLGFLVRGNDDGRGPIGSFGTRARVYTATRSGPGASWFISSTSNDDGGGSESEARGESPLVLASGNVARMVFRGFEQNTSGFGQLMLARLPGEGSTNQFTQLTFGGKQRWFPSAAIDPTNGDLVVVSQDIPGLTPAPDDYALVTTEMSGVADPAVVSLQLSPPWAAPGELVEVEAQVRNLGLANTANDLVVDFFDGPPGSGNLIASDTVGAAIGFLGAGSAFAEIAAVGGAQTVWARVRTAGGNADPSNDVLSASLRTLAAPRHVQVNPSPDAPGALEVSWLAPILDETEGPEPGDVAPAPVIGYRVERSDVAGGPRELAGESTASAFRDALLQPGRPYCYVVTAYDATGLTSPPSDEVCTLAGAAAQPRGVPLPGTSLRLVDRPEKPAARSLAVVSKGPAIGFGLVPGTASDPVLNGATLRVGSSTGDSFDGVYDLPARNWRYVKRRGITQGYKYLVGRGDPAVPVKSLVINLGKSLRLTAKGDALAVSLQGEPDPVDLELTVGDRSYCLRFGGTTSFSPGRSFSARKAPAPAACPLLPAR